MLRWLAERESSSTLTYDVERCMWIFIGLPFAVGIVTYCLGDVSGVKDGREVLEIVFLIVEVEAYLVMLKMLFSPKVISRTPSSQPSLYQPTAISSGVYRSKAPLMTLPTPICI